MSSPLERIIALTIQRYDAAVEEFAERSLQDGERGVLVHETVNARPAWRVELSDQVPWGTITVHQVLVGTPCRGCERGRS